MNKYIGRQHGFSLLELLFVLVLSAGILILGLRQYLHLQHQAYLTQVSEQVDALLQAINGHYYATCRDFVSGVFPDSGWINAPYTPLNAGDVALVPNPDAIFNPFGSNYQIKYGSLSTEEGAPKRIVLSVQANFNRLTASQLENYQALWQANTRSGTQLTWQRFPTQVRDDTGLWVLDSDLSRFKQQESLEALCP